MNHFSHEPYLSEMIYLLMFNISFWIPESDEAVFTFDLNFSESAAIQT